jgi:electron-transferring-flavoprotein dehydrogenase
MFFRYEGNRGMTMDRESMEFDVVFVGGGPANLAAAIRLMQLAQENGTTLEVALIEKGADFGSHSLSGAVLNPVALRELLPDFVERECPVEKTVRDDELYYLTATKAYRIPLVPRYMHNKGLYTISLSRFTRWLANIAEEMGVNLFPGFAGKEVLYGDDGRRIAGVRTGDKGFDRDGKPKANFEPGIDLLAKVTVFGEGARGSLMKDISRKLGLSSGKMPQVYETGIREVIQLPEDNYFKTSRGNDIHSMGYPLGFDTPGGGFIYEMKENRIAIGYLTALCYEDPRLDPYEVFIRFKHHPFVAGILKGGKVIEQGARTVSTGGLYSVPRLAVDGAVFTGGAAAMHNPPALKGIHVSMKSGMLAAEAVFSALNKGDFSGETLGTYQDLFDGSWLAAEMAEGRNFSQALAKKGILKFIHLGAQYFTGGRGIRDRMPLTEDFRSLNPLKKTAGVPEQIPEKKDFDGVLYVDKLTGVYLSKTMHREDQPSHLVVPDLDLCVNTCYPTYGSPCTRFCPGNVYEMEIDEKTGSRRLKLNPSNCFHCKTCDIKDPYENIVWTCPEGGEGPGYTMG